MPEATEPELGSMSLFHGTGHEIFLKFGLDWSDLWSKWIFLLNDPSVDPSIGSVSASIAVYI